MAPRELTFRGLVLGVLITVAFTAANVYLGLKVGLTVASSIPAAVISMAVLSVVRDSSILENNIVQTVASAAGTLASIIFVLPGLVIVGWWTGFPFWQSFLICLCGGVLGVVFTIPLRRALVTTSDLPYPEGVAAAGVTMAAHTLAVWQTQVRFIGAGAIAVSAIWTLATLVKPVVGGLVATIASSKAQATGDPRDRDLPMGWIVALTAACLALTAWLAYALAAPTVLAGHALLLTLIAVPFVFIVGFVVAGVAGYMAGLIGASNSPVSGIGILAVVISASILVVAIAPTPENRPALVAFALMVTGIVMACATISNDNLQDLKTGQLVGASPMRQQIALIVGTVAGAAVIPPVLNLLAKAYGFAGAANIGVVAQNPLPAPQATLIAALAQGVVGASLDWHTIGIGALVGVGLVLLDAGLGSVGRLRLPPLAVGIGIYLPMSATFAVVIGALVATWYETVIRASPNPARTERLGTLVASGLIVGESLFGVLNAGLIVGLDSDAPLALVSEDFRLNWVLAIAGFGASVVALYAWLAAKARATAS
jgi:uncharacterized oligopeptide transporter (OPT) family protein